MKNFMFMLFSFILISCLSYAHEQSLGKTVHQRIIVEAYNLLKLQLSKEASGFADMDNFIGEARFYHNYYWYNNKCVASGSEHEDIEDIVYGFKGVKYKFFPNSEWSHTSITHFWDADNPYGDNTVGDYGEVKLYDGGHFPTAYTKARAYMWDSYSKIFKFPHSGGEAVGYQKLWCNRESTNTYLYNWYWKDKIWVNHAHDVAWYTFWHPFNVHTNYYWPTGNQFCKEIFFNILGRLCHLLTDMGVPEHAKRSMHIGEYTAPFEHWLGDNYDSEFYWTAERVYKERGGFVNPFCEVEGDRNVFLFYTLSQLSDWFCSRGGFPRNGNNNFNSNIGEINSIIQSYAPSEDYYRFSPVVWLSPSLTGWTSWDITDEIGRNFRDVLLPYTIRAVAGMLYKYIIETKMQFPNATIEDMGMVYDQQQELNLFNQEINGNYYTFRAEGNPGRITVCPESRPAGYPADFLIDSEARNVTFRAAKDVIFKPGFTALEGSQVRAYIVQGCSRTNQSGNCQECLEEDFNPQYNKSAQ